MRMRENEEQASADAQPSSEIDEHPSVARNRRPPQASGNNRTDRQTNSCGRHQEGEDFFSLHVKSKSLCQFSVSRVGLVTMRLGIWTATATANSALSDTSLIEA